MLNVIEIHFDGGCKPTNPGRKYGSFEVLLLGKQVFKGSMIPLGHGTNNEAEFDILIHALKWTRESLATAGFPQCVFDVKLFTDSTIVRNRIAKQDCGGKGERARKMGVLTEQCLALLIDYKSAEITWQRRDANVGRFGH